MLPSIRPDILTEMDHVWPQLFAVLRKLIRLHPVHGSATQTTAAELIRDALQRSGWRDVEIIPYKAIELIQEPDYVPVQEFGERYADDEIIPKNIVVGLVNGSSRGPTLIINCHYDVDLVTSPERWRSQDFWNSAHEEADAVYGRGATDMLGGLVAAMLALYPYVNNLIDWSGRIVFTAVPDEEVGGNGTLKSLLWLRNVGLMREYPARNVYCLIPEPTDGQVCLDSLGFLHFRISVMHNSRHMGAESSRITAFTIGLDAIRLFDIGASNLSASKSVSKQDFVLNIGTIKSGEDPSIPPAVFTAEGVMLFPPRVSRIELELAIAQEIENHTPTGVRCEFSPFGFEGASFGGSTLSEAILNSDPHITLGPFRSPCDARLYSRWGIPTVIFGPGSLEQAHAIDEYIRQRDIRVYAHRLVVGLAQFLQPASGENS